MNALQLGMICHPLMVARRGVRARSNDQAASRTHVLLRLSPDKFPGGKRVVERPIIPTGNYEWRRIEKPAQIDRLRMRHRESVRRDCMTEDRGEKLHVEHSDTVCARSLLDELRASRAGKGAVMLPQPTLSRGWRHRPELRIARKQRL